MDGAFCDTTEFDERAENASTKWLPEMFPKP
jgi:hypothetical protein